MIKKHIPIIVLALVLLNIPSITLETLSISISSPISYLLFLLLAVLIFLEDKRYPKEIIFLAVISSLYFFIAAINYNGLISGLIIVYIKFLLYLFGLYTAIKKVNKKKLLIILLLGSTTILLDSLFFRFNDFIGDGYISEYGRYSGFYLNPNIAAMICIFGYVLSLNMKNKLSILAVFFTFLGILTLSRAFIVSWVLITSIFIFYNKRTLFRLPIMIIAGFIFLTTFSKQLKLDSQRFDLISGLFSGKINQEVFMENNRQDQWAKYYDAIGDAPILGNGYKSFTSESIYDNEGVHNSFLLILGESGILPFILFAGFFIWAFKKSYKISKFDLLPLLSAIVLSTICLVSHNLFDSGIQIFILTFIVYSLIQERNKRLI